MAGNIKLTLILVLVGLIVVFSIQNVAQVEVQFLLWSFTTRRAVLIFVVLALGIVIGWIMHGVQHRARRKPAGDEARGIAEQAGERAVGHGRERPGQDA